MKGGRGAYDKNSIMTQFQLQKINYKRVIT